MINQDPAVRDKLQVLFVQNYNCSYAEHIIPAADVSEHRARGLGTGQHWLNGAVTLGTMDGATEIVQKAGLQTFGASVEELNAIRIPIGPGAFTTAIPPGHQYPGRRHRHDEQREFSPPLLTALPGTGRTNTKDYDPT